MRHETSSRVAGRCSRVAAHHEPQLRDRATVRPAPRGQPRGARARGRVLRSSCALQRLRPRSKESHVGGGVNTGSVPVTRELMREGGGTSSKLKTSQTAAPFYTIVVELQVIGWKPRACELHSGSANEDRVRLPSAMPDAPPLRPREGGRSRSARGRAPAGSRGRKNFLFLVEVFLER